MKNAFLSVSNKDRLDLLAKHFFDHGVNMIATGGTKKYIEDLGLPVQSIETITRKPEAFQGRMKSISFELASGILYRRGDKGDEEDRKKLEIPSIDYVVVNFYPFEEKREEKLSEEQMVDYIDIGGPTMLRAAAKNFKDVTILSNPEQYESFVKKEADSTFNVSHRKELAKEAFRLSQRYDAAIFEHFSFQELRYGENPQQAAKVFYDAKVWQILHEDKALSYNNWLDVEAAKNILIDFQKAFSEKNTVCVIKHNNPCGLAASDKAEVSLQQAWAGDPVSAFGSIVGFSGECDLAAATFLKDKFIEVVLAKSFSEEAFALLKTKKNLRLLTYAPLQESQHSTRWNSLSLSQDYDTTVDYDFQWQSKRKDAKKEKLAKFSILCSKHLKSNAIALCRETKEGFQMVGAGMGQPNRIDCLKRLAVPRMQDYFPGIDTKEIFLASDAFFPFADAVEEAAKVGIEWIAQPGGSIRDEEVIAKADASNVAMLFYKSRHFKH